METFKLKARKNNDLNIKKVRMECDDRPKGLNKHLPYHFFMYLNGGPGSGKTNLIINLINIKKSFYHKVFHNIHIFSPSLHTLGKKLDLPAEMLHEAFDIDEINAIVEHQKENPKDETLLILDDCVNDLKMNSPEILTIIYNRRHLNMSIIITSQKYAKLPNNYRAVVSDLINFNKGKKELNSIFDDYVNIPRPLFDSICRFCFDEKHNFMYMKTQCPTEDKYYRNFDKIMLTPEMLDELI